MNEERAQQHTTSASSDIKQILAIVQLMDRRLRIIEEMLILNFDEPRFLWEQYLAEVKKQPPKHATQAAN